MSNAVHKLAVLAASVFIALGVSACATSSSQSSPRSPNQTKQQELLQMERQGQRNDIDKPLQ